MRSKTVPVKNVSRLTAAADALLDRAHGTPGMGLVEGHTGYGKTTATVWLHNRVNGVLLRAMATWTPTAMLHAVLNELGHSPKGTAAKLTELAIDALTKSGRPLFIDETDYLVGSDRMLQTLRDLHDMSNVPVILIGEAGISRKLAHLPRLTGRIMQEVRFGPLDAEDTQLVAKELCEVEVRDSLVERIQQDTAGSMRLTVVSLARIEQFARVNGMDAIGIEEWGKKTPLFTGEAPGRTLSGKSLASSTGVGRHST